MYFYVYMLLCINKNCNISYIGYSSNPAKRLNQHNNSKGAKFTRGRKWKIIYKRRFNDKISALKYEYKLKKDYKLRKKIKENNNENFS